MKLGTHGILGSLITNRLSDFKNSKWRIQDGGRRNENRHDIGEHVYSRVFPVADYESVFRFFKFKMADATWLPSK